MLWIFICLFCVGLFLLFFILNACSSSDFSSGVGISAIAFICFAFISGIFIIYGIGAYPTLMADKAKIETLRARIPDIKGSLYKERNFENPLVAGSLDNFKQSTNVSVFIADLSKLESEYNAKLTRYKVYKTSIIYWLITDVAFVDDRALNLQEIK